MKRILILSNHHSYTYNFRKEIVQALLEKSYEVWLAFPYGEKVKSFEEMGCRFIDVPFDRQGKNPLSDLILLYKYCKIIAKIKPQVVLSYTVKPNIYGGIASRVMSVPYIANITGGVGVVSGDDSIIEKVAINLYKVALKKANCVFFQNNEIKERFLQREIVINNYKLIPGSGVNLNEHKFEEYPTDDDKIKLLFIGRITKDKGIEELINAAKIIKKDYPYVCFDAIGFYENDYKQRIKELEMLDIIQFHGMQEDAHTYIKNSHAIILPSYHEGMSNALLEAASSGRPLLASNIHGCKETFDDGVSGFGFEPKDVNSMVNAIHKFVQLSNDEKKKMGVMSRKKIEKEFDRSIIVNAYMSQIEEIGGLE